jgi:hypothetical protein
MRKFRLCGVALVALCALPVAAGELEDVVAKHLEARGGLDKIEAVKSARITGKMIFPGGAMEAPLVLQWKEPNKLRMEFTLQGMTGIQAYDGETGWAVMPFQGRTDPEPMSEEQLEQIDEQADFHGAFVNSEEKGYTLEYLGKEEIEGTEAHKIKVTNKHGEETLVFLDAEYFLEIKSESKRTIRGQELEIEASQGDYKDVDGLMLAHSVESKPKGMEAGQSVIFEKIELNVPLDDALFEMPEKKVEEPAETE